MGAETQTILSGGGMDGFATNQFTPFQVVILEILHLRFFFLFFYFLIHISSQCKTGTDAGSCGE